MSIYLNTQKIIKDWLDYNGHMNVAYYVLIFDIYGAEKLMTQFKMGEHSAKTTKKSTMVVETHTTYNLSLIHISEPTRPERIGDGVVWV